MVAGLKEARNGALEENSNGHESRDPCGKCRFCMGFALEFGCRRQLQKLTKSYRSPFLRRTSTS
jgi:hypothetical protein